MEVRVRQGVTKAGRLYRKPVFVSDIRAADQNLDSLVSLGLLRRSREREFELREHFHSVDAWRSCLTRPFVGELRADPGWIERACDLMSTGEGEIITRETSHAIRFQRV